MKADDFLRKNPLFDVQDIEFLKADGEHDQKMLDIWHNQLETNKVTSSSKELYLKAI